MILDACQRGCGGIWLDAQELDRINQTIPAVAPLFAEVERAVGIQVDEKRVRQCVRCSGAKLERKLFSLGAVSSWIVAPSVPASGLITASWKPSAKKPIRNPGQCAMSSRVPSRRNAFPSRSASCSRCRFCACKVTPRAASAHGVLMRK